MFAPLESLDTVHSLPLHFCFELFKLGLLFFTIESENNMGDPPEHNSQDKRRGAQVKCSFCAILYQMTHDALGQ